MTRPAATNGLLAALPADERDALLPHLEPVSVPIRTVLHEPGEPISHVYFPTTGVVSLLSVPAGGDGVEAGVIGREGFVGLPVFLGTDRTTGRCVVQVPLQALRMTSANFRSEVKRDGSLHALLLTSALYFLLCQVSQSLAQASPTPSNSGLCRWLPSHIDRTGGGRFPTHEFLANMLGVRRASVSEVAAGLQDRGLIRYSRGQVNVLSRAGLEQSSCECFQVIQAEWDRLFE